jgi:single-strand DNA-binding protein
VYETYVTVIGNVADSPRRSNLSSGAVTNFRMASTVRRFDSASEGYVDGRTLWVDVECWDSLSSNVSASISKGDPVIVYGTLSTQEWESENGKRSKNCIRAFAVGPNLGKGRATFTRDQIRRNGGATDALGEPGGPAGGGVPEQEQPAPAEEPQAGRDYVGEDEALYGADADDLSREPAHA